MNCGNAVTNNKGTNMSLSFITIKEIALLDLFDGRLERYGIRQHGKGLRCLVDAGENFLRVHHGRNGNVDSYTCYAGDGMPIAILSAIAKAFNTKIVSDHEPEYWGLCTVEEQVFSQVSVGLSSFGLSRRRIQR